MAVTEGTVFKGRLVELCVQRVRLPNGRTTEVEVVHHPGAAAMVPVDDDGQVVLVRQYRPSVGGWVLEVPAGKLDAGEPPGECAARELEEEVGLSARRLDGLGAIWTTPGFTDERIWLYLARELEPAEQRLGEHEVLTIERMPFRKALALAASGEIDDAKTVCALYRAHEKMKE